MTVGADASDRERRLDEAVAAYLEASASGRTPDPSDWLRSYPDLAEELTDFFADQERFDSLMAPLRTPRRPLAVHEEEPSGVRMVGGYELLEEVGQGGMGVIYRARHMALNRIVALKMLRAAEWALPEERQRLLWEAEAVARLDHPNIVPIYEVGEVRADDGSAVPFFSMRLVEGGSLSRHRDRLAGDWHSVARIVSAAARAIAHAHRRGILHRDLKPANVLLEETDAGLATFVTDFGLAKHLPAGADTSRGGGTRTGMAVGTPSYIAPEQASGTGPLTTAADVYSLGAVLYELLTGRPPFRAETPLETLRQALEQEPAAPCALDRRVPRDLETVCLKCLQKDPARRYRSADELADDLERFLAGAPVLARPVGTANRLWRWCRRRPALASLSLALAVTFAVGLPLLVWSWRRAERGEQAALEALDEAERQRKAENDSFRLANQAVDEIYLKLADERLRHVPGSQPVRKVVLEAALRYYQTFLTRRANDPRLRSEMAEVQYRIGHITGAIGSKQASAESFERALADYRDLLASDPGNAHFRRQVAGTWNLLGTVYTALNRPADAAAALRESSAAWARYAADHPADAAGPVGQAGALINLAVLHQGRAEWDQTLAVLREAEAVLTNLLPRHPGQSGARLMLAQCEISIGQAEANLGLRRESAAAYERARETCEGLVRAAPQDPGPLFELASSYRGLALARAAAGQSEESQQLAARARKILEELVRTHPAITDYRWTLAIVLDDLGIAEKQQKHYAAAGTAYRRAEDLLRRLVADDPGAQGFRSSLAAVRLNLGLLHLATGHPSEARQALQKSRADWERLLSENPATPAERTNLVHTLNYLAEANLQLHQPSEAAAALEPAVRHTRLLLDRTPGDRAVRKILSSTLGNLAIAQRAAGHPDEALRATQGRQALWPDNAEELFDAAGDFARTAALLAQKQASPDQADDLALSALRAARGAGFRDRERLRTDPDLARLRGRAEFQALLAEMAPPPNVGRPRP